MIKRPPVGLPRATIFLAFAVGFMNMAQRSGFGVLYPNMAADQGWTASEVTAAFSTAMLIYSPAALLAGFLVDRFGVRRTMLAGTSLFGLGMVGISLCRELWQIYLVYAVAIGLGTAMVGFVPMIKTLSLTAGSRLGFALGLFNGGQGVGALIASPLLQLLLDSGGWRLGYVVLGVAALIFLIPLVLRGAPDRALDRAAPHGRGLAGGGLVRQRAFWLMLVANSTMGYLLLLPAHHVAHLLLVGLPDILAATVGGMMGAFIGVGAILGGWASDRWGANRLGPFGAALLAAGVTALLLVGPFPYWIAAVYVLAGGLGRGMIGVSLATFQARVFAGPSLGRVTGLLDLGFGIGAFAGPYLTALGRDTTGSYVPGLSTAIPAGALAASCVLLARRKIASS